MSYEPAVDFGDEQSRLEREEAGLARPKRTRTKPAPAKMTGPVALSEADLADVWARDHGKDWRWRPGVGWLRWTHGEGWLLDDAGHHLGEIADLGRRCFARKGDDNGPRPDPRTGGATRTARATAEQAQAARRCVGWDEARRCSGSRAARWWSSRRALCAIARATTS